MAVFLESVLRSSGIGPGSPRHGFLNPVRSRILVPDLPHTVPDFSSRVGCHPILDAVSATQSVALAFVFRAISARHEATSRNSK